MCALLISLSLIHQQNRNDKVTESREGEAVWFVSLFLPYTVCLPDSVFVRSGWQTLSHGCPLCPQSIYAVHPIRKNVNIQQSWMWKLHSFSLLYSSPVHFTFLPDFHKSSLLLLSFAGICSHMKPSMNLNFPS